MKIEIIRHANDLEKIKQDWRRLYKKDDTYSVFQSFEYNFYSVYSQYDNQGELFVITLDHNGKIIEIWPCILYGKNLRFINQIHSDFCDILSENHTDEVINFIQSSEEITSISFKNIKSSSRVFKLVSDLNNCFISNEINYSELELSKTDSFPSNFSHFVYRQRRRIKRIMKKYNGEIVICSGWNDYLDYIFDIVRLENSMINRKIRPSLFLNSVSILIHELIFSHKLQMSVLKIEDKICAISFFFKKKNEYSFWIDLYDDKQMINLYHNILFIKKITELTQANFNFGRGDYKYKIQNFGPKIFPLYTINVFKNKFHLFSFRIRNYLYNFVRLVYRRIKQ